MGDLCRAKAIHTEKTAKTFRLAQLLGGELTFVSQESKGSTFALLIPTGIDITTKPSLQKDKPVAQIFPARQAPPLYSGNALIAEDDKSCQLLITELLERMGLETTTADDGKEAIEKSKNQSFDLIFMDVRMPNLNGLEATKILRKNKTKIPIIAITAHAMEGDRKSCIKAGCDEYLSKPIDHNKLVEILDRHLPAKQRS